MILNKFIKHSFIYQGSQNIFISFNILKEHLIVKWNYTSLFHGGIFNYYCKYNSASFSLYKYYFISSAILRNRSNILLQHFYYYCFYNVPHLLHHIVEKNKMNNSLASNLNMNKNNENEKGVNENNAVASFSKNNSEINKNFKNLAQNGNPAFNIRQSNKTRTNAYNRSSANNGIGNYMNYGIKNVSNNNSVKNGNSNNVYYNRDGNMKKDVDTYKETNNYRTPNIHSDAYALPIDSRINTRMNYGSPIANVNVRENKINFTVNENRTMDCGANDDREKNEITQNRNRDYIFSRGDPNNVSSREIKTSANDHGNTNELLEKGELRNLGLHHNASGSNNSNVATNGVEVMGVGGVSDMFHYINGNQDNSKYSRGIFNTNKKNSGVYVANKNVNSLNTLRNNENIKRYYVENAGGNNAKKDIINNANFGSCDIRSNVPPVNMNDVSKYGGIASGSRNITYQGNNILYEQMGKTHIINEQINNNVANRKKPLEQNINLSVNRNRAPNKSVYDVVENGSNGFIGSKENEKSSYGVNMEMRNIPYDQKNTESMEGEANKVNFHEDRRRDFVLNASPSPKKIIFGMGSGNRNMHTIAARGGGGGGGEEDRKNLIDTDKTVIPSPPYTNRNITTCNIPPPPNSTTGPNSNINTSLNACLYLDCKEFEKYMYKEENILTLYYIRRNYMKAESKEDCKKENEKIKYVISWVFNNDEKVMGTGYHVNKTASKKLCIEELLKKLKNISLLELEQMTKWMVNSLNVILKIESKNVETKFNESTNMYHSTTEWKVNNKLFKGIGVSEYEKIAEMMGAQNLYMTLYNVKNELIKEAERLAGHEHHRGGVSGHGNTSGNNARQSRNKPHEENNAAINNPVQKNYSDTQLYKAEGNNNGNEINKYIDTRGPNEHYQGIHLKSASYETIPLKPVAPPPIVSNANMYSNTLNTYNMGNYTNVGIPIRHAGMPNAGNGQYVNAGTVGTPEWNGSGNTTTPIGGDSRTTNSEYVSYNLTKHDCSVIQILKHNIASKYKIIQTETVDVVPNGYKCILHWECKTGRNNFKISSVGFGATKNLAKAEASYDMLIKNNLIEYVSPGDRKNAQQIKDLISVDLNKAVQNAIQFIHTYGSESWSIFLVNMFREIIAANNYDAATKLLTAVIEASKKGRAEIDEATRLEEENKTMQQKLNNSCEQLKTNTDVGIGESASVEQVYPYGKTHSYEPMYLQGGIKGPMGRPINYMENGTVIGGGTLPTSVAPSSILTPPPPPPGAAEPQNAMFFQNVYNSNVRKHINNQYIHRLISVELWEKLIDECVVCLNSKLSFHCISLLQQMELDRSFFISTAAHNYYKKYRIMLALELQANINQSVQEKKDFEYLHDNKSLLLKIKTCTLPIISCTCILTLEEKEWLKTTQMKEDDIVLLKPHDSDLREEDCWANILMGSITSAKYDNTVYNVNIRLFSADHTKKACFQYTKYKMYLLLNIVTHERMLQVLKAITFIGAIPSQSASPYCFTPEIRFLLLHTYNKYSRHIAQKGRVNEEIAIYEKMKMDFFNNESIKNNADDLIAEYRNESKNPYEDLLNEALNKQIDKDNIEEIDKFLIESVNLPTNLPLNDSQKLACISAMTRRLTLVQGPPGTGKTHVACAIVDSWHRQNSKKKILAVADSNVAANNLVEGLKKRNIQAVRVGAATDVDFHEDAIKEFTRYKELLKLRKDNKLKEAKIMKALLFQEAVKKYNVVIATCVGSGHEIFDDERFERVIIDECAQSIEPSNLIPLGHYCNNLVLIGDHKQLPPTIISTDAAKMGLEVSLLERFITAKIAPVHLLSTQRRMHLSICVFPNMHFYNNKLKTANVTDENRPIIKGFMWPNPKCRVAFIDVSIGKPGSKFENAYGTSKFNIYEIEPLISVLKSVINEGCVSIDEIGILTAYDAQKIKLKAAVQKAFSYEAACRIEIDSIDGFQGKEKDLILFSAVRSNASNELGFLRDARRMNVMLTRAKRGVILFGDQFTLANDPTNWLPWLTWVASKRAIIHLTKLNDHLDSVDYSLFDKLNKINKSINFNNIQVSDNYYYYGNDTGFSNDYNNMDMSPQISADLKIAQAAGTLKDGTTENIEEEIVESWEDLF